MNNQVFNFFYGLSSEPFIAKLAIFLSYPFTYIVLFSLVIWAIFISKRKMYNFSLFFLSGVFSWLMAFILKIIFKIPRPFISSNIIPLYQETGFSFPSEHMAVFTAISISMFLVNRKFGFLFLLIALMIGFSRIIIGVHYPVDIIGGFLVGLIISIIFREIFKKI